MTQGENPTNAMQDHMWDFLKDGGHQFNPEGLRNAVYALIRATTQKDGGQRSDSKGVQWSSTGAHTNPLLDMVYWQIICEAAAFVLSGELEGFERYKAQQEVS